MKPSTATLSAGAAIALVALQSLGLLGGGAPNLLSPASVLLVFPVFMGFPPLIVVVIFVVAFLLWRPALFSGEARIPTRTLVLLAAVAVLSAVFYVSGWSYGIKYQGALNTGVCLALSVLLLVGCIVAAWRGRKRPSFPTSLALHSILFVWVASYAFPYLGEAP